MKMTVTLYGKNGKVLAKLSFEAMGFVDANTKALLFADLNGFSSDDVSRIEIERA